VKRHVEFWWDDIAGECYDCGLPAAYRLIHEPVEPTTPVSPTDLRCSVCAAFEAASGTRIEYLHAEKEMNCDKSHCQPIGNDHAHCW
jgi:hypothetical protein